MSKQDFIFRYLAIIRKLRNNGEATFSEIASYLAEQTELADRPVRLSIRTFQRDLKEIELLFRVRIAYDFSRKVYFIEEDEHNDLNNRMLESLDTINTLRMATDLSAVMFVEKRKAHGTQHFHGLVHAIQNRIVLLLSHQKFDDDEPTIREVAPYALKESRGRWYLLAKDLSDKRIKTFGLDRILSFQNTARRFDYPKKLDVNQHFRYCFGVINPDDQEPAEIILAFSPEQGKYVKSYPLHESQEVISDTPEELRIRLFLYVTYDLIQEILSYGDRVNVLAPLMLWEKVAGIVERMYKKRPSISQPPAPGL
jgi:predicted DNA-binding transcriptional regulator YafY